MVSEKRLIDANALMDSHWWESLTDDFDKARAKIIVMSAPTVDAVEVVHGRWIELPSMAPEYKCSECGQSYEWWEVSEAHYCPNCGAKMDGERKDNA